MGNSIYRTIELKFNLSERESCRGYSKWRNGGIVDSVVCTKFITVEKLYKTCFHTHKYTLSLSLRLSHTITIQKFSVRKILSEYNIFALPYTIDDYFEFCVLYLVLLRPRFRQTADNTVYSSCGKKKEIDRKPILRGRQKYRRKNQQNRKRIGKI